MYLLRNGLMIVGLTLVISHGAMAQDETIDAPVINRTPIVESVQRSVPKRVCYQEQVITQEKKSYTPSILGGIVGAAVGNEFGKGRGQDLATIAGGVLGASVGRDVQNQNAQNHSATVERCHNEEHYEYEDRVTGWRVTYEYNGQSYVTRTDRDPGETIKLHIHVQPEN